MPPSLLTFEFLFEALSKVTKIRVVLGSGCDFLQGKHACEATTSVVLRTHQATRGHTWAFHATGHNQERVIVFGQSAGDPFHLRP